MLRRQLHPNWKPLRYITNAVAHSENRQRPLEQRILPLSLDEMQEDSVYQCAELGRVSAEMPRADISGDDWGGYDVDTLRIAGLCRSVLIRLGYCHTCTPTYCLKGRCTCRFIWPSS